MIPKIEFVYSWIYDDLFRQNWQKEKKKFVNVYPSADKIENYLKDVEILWKKYSKEILSELSNIAKLKWKENKIKCYVAGVTFPFSDPLTLPIYKDKSWFLDVLTHELIHQLFIQNEKEIKKSFDYFLRKYSKQPFNTQIHIPLHAIHSALYLRIFDKKRLMRDIKIMSCFPDYKKSWEIVEKVGHENLINEFRGRLI